MIIMKGICYECTDGKEKRLAKRKPPLCGYHYSKQQQKKSAEKNKNKPKKPIKPLKRTPIKKTPLNYKRKPTGELSLFEEIWNERPHESFINGEPIYKFSVNLFAHVLSKAENRFPNFKLYKKAVVIITHDQHDKWDKGLREDLRKLPEWNKMFELEEELKQEYKLKYGK